MGVKLFLFLDLLALTTWYPDPAPFWPKNADGRAVHTDATLRASDASDYLMDDEQIAHYRRTHYPAWMLDVGAGGVSP